MWIVPSTSSRSVPATASEISRSDWRFLALERECTWREKHMPARLWHARWKAVPWLQTVASGLICEASTPDPSLEPWIASWRPTRANPSVMLACDSENPIRGTSGPSSAKSSASPTLPWYSSKTLEAICEEDSAASAAIFNEWASALRRDCGLRRKWAHRTVASDSLPWPTPTGRDSKNPERSAAGLTRKADGGWSVDLNTAAHLWAQPGYPAQKAAENSGAASMNSTPSTATANQSKNGTATLTKPGARRNWQSPQARDHRDGRIEPETAAKHLGSRPLNEEVLNWPSPAVTDGDSAARQTTTTGVMHPGMSLTDAIREFSTSLPTAPETGPAGKTCWCGLRGCVHPLHRRKLNIYFSEWLMGWPINWSSAATALTGFEQWETASVHSLWQWLSAYCARPMGLGVSNQMDLF